MSVLSGPTMLHQAALTAVKQWRYQPAELDGKPTSMHLTVVVQFKLQ
jgi:TonB family protein